MASMRRSPFQQHDAAQHERKIIRDHERATSTAHSNQVRAHVVAISPARHTIISSRRRAQLELLKHELTKQLHPPSTTTHLQTRYLMTVGATCATATLKLQSYLYGRDSLGGSTVASTVTWTEAS